MDEKGEQLWAVSIKGENPRQTPESDLLNSDKYQILSAYQDVADIGILRNSRARKQKRIRAAKAILSEKERSRKALEKQESAMYEDFNTVNVAINSGKFDFAMMRTSQILPPICMRRLEPLLSLHKSEAAHFIPERPLKPSYR